MRVLHIAYHFGLLHRNNPLWGTKAAKRLKRHQRSMSDPDVNQVAMLSTIPSYLIAYSDRGSTPNMEKSESGKYGTESANASPNHLKATGMGRSVSSPHCIREAKDQHIRTFLETMAYEDEDLGIMENTASNSTSEFSSPLSLTPPDVEGVLSLVMRGSEAKCSRKEGDFEPGKGRREEGRKGAKGAEGSDERDGPEEEAILMSAVGGRRRNSDLPEFAPKIYSNPEDAFLAGKRASVAEMHIFVQAADSDKGVSAERSLAGVAKIVEHASSMEDVEEDGEMVEDRAVKSPRLSQSHSFPEELNTMESQDEETNDMHLAVRQHRRSRSELQMNEISTEMDSKEESSLPITAPQIESVRERVKEMEKQAVNTGSSTLLEPAVNNWYKRVYSAPSLHSVSSGMCLTPPHELAVSVSRPSSRASNWEEIAEETEEEETVTFTASDEAGTPLPASPPCEQTMDCGQTEEKQQEGEIDGASAVSHGQVTEQVSVEEKRPLYRGLCWEPVHSRSQSNVESSSVRAMIETLEKKTQPLHASMQSLVRSDDSQKSGGEGEEGLLQEKAEEEDDGLVVEGVGSGSGRVVENTQQEGCVVKRTQSLGALYHGSDQGPPLQSSHTAVKKHDSYPFSMGHGEPRPTIPEIETTDGISADKNAATQSKDSDKSNLVEMESLSASVLELTQKFEERKPKPPPQIKHSFSSSSGAPHKMSTSRPVSSDEERGRSASPGPASVDPPSLNL